MFNSSTSSYTSPKGKYLTLKNETVNGKAGFSLKDKDGFTKYFELDPSNGDKYRLYAYQDSNNNKILFSYTGTQLTEIAEVDASNTTIRNSIKLSYDTAGKLEKTSFKDRSIEYKYNNYNELVNTIVHSTGTDKTITNTYSYNDIGLLNTYIDGKNHPNSLDYKTNSISVLTPQENGLGSVKTDYAYNKKVNSYVVSDTTGKETTYKRDTTNNTFAVSDVQNADNTTSKTVYDSNYNVLSETDENGKTETNQYDVNGNVVKSIDKEEKTTSYVYDGKNQVLEQTDPDGIKTVNTYIGYNLESSTVGEEVTKHEYDGYGRETKVTYPNNTFTTTTYDEVNKKTTITDAKGNTTSTVYNDYGEVISETDGENRTTSYTLDLLDPAIKTSVTDGKGNTTSYHYDDNGNMTALTNANGKTKTYKYDGNDELLESVFPVNNTQTIKVTNTYDENGNLKTVKQASGITEDYAYDDVDQLKTVTVKKSSGQDSLQWTNTFDDAGQLLTRNFKDLALNKPLVDKVYTYTANNLTATYKQGNYSTNYGYDEMARLKNETTNYSDTEQALKINQAITYTAEGKVDTVIADAGGDSLISMDYSYDLQQNKAAVSFQGGLFKNAFAYDSSNNLTSIDYTKGSETPPALSFGYTYDKSGNIKTETSRNGTAQYVYDANNQLIKETLPNGSTNEFQYDKVGNRTKLIQNGTETNYTYNDGNQIATKNGVPSFTYDADGNLKKDDKYQYEYNDLGAQTKVTTLANSEVAKYEYDEEGLRTKKIIGTKTYEYYYDGEDDNLGLEVTKENNQIQKYRYYQWNDAGKVVGMVVKDKNASGAWQTNTYYFWTNQRGDVTSIVDNKGTEVGSYTYDAFGNVLSESGTIAKENSIRYASYYYDQETKHYYLQARYYDPQNGNFLALDPYPGDDNDTLSQNGYTYASNNPVMFVDPDGNNPILVAIGIVALNIAIYQGKKQAIKYLTKQIPKAVKSLKKNYNIKFNQGSNLVLVTKKGHKGKGGRVFSVEYGRATFINKANPKKKKIVKDAWHFHIGDGHYTIPGVAPRGYRIQK
ncbi:RHS repeat-associated core domain-containing protein [Niallia sp. 03133]|uniref:RHS repeat-associated core domain-containing protein n=1 Tax=Niallia sp. 03133 TaxID=3458060 RepID=UPI0040448058